MVDSAGNPHFFTIISNRANPYAPELPFAKFAADITSPDQGATWEVDYIAPIYTLKGSFGTPDPQDGSLFEMYNYPQASRTEDGSRVFFSWADSDTTLIGFGEAENLSPNLFIAGKRISDGYKTNIGHVTGSDARWDGKVRNPTMAPTVFEDQGRYFLPLVLTEMTWHDQNSSCDFWYFGNEATICEGDFVPPSSIIYDLHNPVPLGVGPCLVGREEIISDHLDFQVFPNPASDEIHVEVGNINGEVPRVELHSLTGHLVFESNFPEDRSSLCISLEDFPSGVYFIRIWADGKVGIRKLLKVE